MSDEQAEVETDAVGDPAGLAEGLAQALADLPADLPPADAEVDNPPEEAEAPGNATSEAQGSSGPGAWVRITPGSASIGDVSVEYREWPADSSDPFLGISDEELITVLRSRAHADHQATGSRESRHMIGALDAVRGHIQQRRRARNR